MNKFLIYSLTAGLLVFGYTQYKPKIVPNTKETQVSDINFVKLENPATLNTGVHLISASWCGYCKKLRAVLQQNNIPFKEYNAEGDAKIDAFLSQNNIDNGVPVTVIGGDIVYGYDADKLNKTFIRNGLQVSGL